MIQTTKHDVVFSGHGAVLPEAGRVTRVPYGVEFYMFGPPCITITDALGQKLEGGYCHLAPIHHLAAHRLSVSLTADYCHRGFGGDTEFASVCLAAISDWRAGGSTSYFRC